MFSIIARPKPELDGFSRIQEDERRTEGLTGNEHIRVDRYLALLRAVLDVLGQGGRNHEVLSAGSLARG